MDVIELLDAATKHTGSDIATARAIGVPKQRISNWRHGQQTLPLYHAAKLSELIGKRWYDPALKILADQAKNAKEKEYWLGKFAELRKAAAAVLIIAAALLLAANDANANELAAQAHQMGAIADVSGLYNAQHSRRRRRLRRSLRRIGWKPRRAAARVSARRRQAPQGAGVAGLRPG